MNVAISAHRPMTAAWTGRVGVLLAVLAMGAGCAPQPAARPSTTKPAPTPQLVDLGRRLYDKQCAACHGLHGAGDGHAAYLLYPKPRDFTQNEFRLVSTNTMQATDEDLFQTITRGMPGSAMPPWEAFTPEQRWALVYYVRHLTGASEPVDPAVVIPVPPETPKTPEGLARGRQLFVQACAACHGPQGKGDGPQAMADNAGFPIKPRDLTAGIFKGSSQSRDLYYRIVAGLPGSPMPGYAGAYSDEQLWDLVHYAQSLVPPGVEERVRLRQGTIRAHRVRGEIPLEPSAEAWRAAPPVYVALTPLWWRDRRIEGVEVKALHNGKELALHLAWTDRTCDNSTLTPQTFSDGAAVQFALDADPPFFGMGDANGAVQLWHWKAAWQEDLKGWRDVEAVYPHAAVDWYEAQRDYRHGDPFEVSRSQTASQDPAFMGGWGAGNPLSDPHRASAAEESQAKGLGTLTSRPPAFQQVQADGVWQEGRWQVVIRRPLAPDKEREFGLRPGQEARCAFAVWDGQANDRNGQKSVSIWQVLQLER